MRFLVIVSREKVSFGGIEFHLLNARGPSLNVEVLVGRRDFPSTVVVKVLKYRLSKRFTCLRKAHLQSGMWESQCHFECT